MDREDLAKFALAQAVTGASFPVDSGSVTESAQAYFNWLVQAVDSSVHA